MKFKIGDRVNFLDDKGGGTVTRIIDNNIVHVEIEDGFEVPVVATNLILVSSGANYNVTGIDDDRHLEEEMPATDENITPLKLSNDQKDLPAEGIYFAIVPENQEKPLAGNLMLFLVNHSDYQVLFSLYTNESGVFYGNDFGYIEPSSKLYLDTIERTKIENWVNSLLQVNFFKEGKTTILQPLSQMIVFKPVKTYKEDAFKYEPIIDSKAIMVNLGLIENLVFNPYSTEKFSSEKINLIKEKVNYDKNYPGIKKPKEKSFLDKHQVAENIAEVDLHIHKLVDNIKDFENKDLLDIQIDYFKKCISQAEKERYLKIVFIHGVGDGILKNEIENHLEKIDGIRYYDAPYNRYGMGATEVLFYRNK